MLATDTDLIPPRPELLSQTLDAMRTGQVRGVDIHPDAAPGR